MTTKTITVETNGKTREKTAYAVSFARQYLREQIVKQPFIGRVNISENIGGLISVEVEQGWGVNCRISFTLDYRVSKDYTQYKDVEIGWSSTGRDLANATAAIALYTQLTAVAAQLDSILKSWQYFYDDEDGTK